MDLGRPPCKVRAGTSSFFFLITFLFEVGMQALLSSLSPPPLSVLQPMKRMGPVETPLGTFM